MTTPTNFTPVPLDPVQLGSSIGDVYSAGSSGAFVTYILLINDTTTAVTASVYYVPSGGSYGDDNIIAKDIVVPSNGVAINLLEKLMGQPFQMEASSKIRGIASAASQVTVQMGVVDLA